MAFEPVVSKRNGKKACTRQAKPPAIMLMEKPRAL